MHPVRMPRIKEATLPFKTKNDNTNNTCDVATQTLFMPPIVNPSATKNMQIVYPSPRIKAENPQRIVLPIKTAHQQQEHCSTLYSLHENKIDPYKITKSDLVDCQKLIETDLKKLRDSKATTTASQITAMPLSMPHHEKLQTRKKNYPGGNNPYNSKSDLF